METYKANVFCKNCNFKGEIDIQKGQTIEFTECTNCGNNTLIKHQDVIVGRLRPSHDDFR